MDLYDIDFTLTELQFIRQTLDLPTISAKDAKFLAGLQIKIETEIEEIGRIKVKEEERKQKELEELIASNQAKSSSTKK